MAKKRAKWADFDVLIGEKTAKMKEFTGKTPKKVESPGIYAIGSKQLKIIGIWVSSRVNPRVRKLRSDFHRGKKVGVIEQMGLRWQGDVMFQVLEECPEILFRTKLRYWAEDAAKKGYTIWNDWGSMTRENKPDAGIWEPRERLRGIMDRFSMTDDEILGVLDTLERGLEHSRGRG